MSLKDDIISVLQDSRGTISQYASQTPMSPLKDSLHKKVESIDELLTALDQGIKLITMKNKVLLIWKGTYGSNKHSCLWWAGGR